MNSFGKYLNSLHDIVNSSVVSDHAGEPVVCETAIGQAIDLMHNTRDAGGKIIFVGNGGSAAIASHVSVDLTKNANIQSVNFNEADLITCFSNDYGYERWIEKAIDFYADDKDVLILSLIHI